MSKNAEPSARFVRELADLCGDIANLGYQIDTANMSFAHFGSWSITLTKGHQGIEFHWDGRESEIIVNRWPKPNSGALKKTSQEYVAAPADPKKWVSEYLKGLDTVTPG
jgi:hypothetical protein